MDSGSESGVFGKDVMEERGSMAMDQTIRKLLPATASNMASQSSRSVLYTHNARSLDCVFPALDHERQRSQGHVQRTARRTALRGLQFDLRERFGELK